VTQRTLLHAEIRIISVIALKSHDTLYRAIEQITHTRMPHVRQHKHLD
jgi:hypothetical protein